MSKGLSHSINLELFKKEVKASGKSIPYLAERLGISEQALRNKMNGKASFYVEEVMELCRVLHINSLGEMAEVFNIVLII